MRAASIRSKPKARYYDKDMQDWAHLYGLKIGHPTVFPVNSVKAMRGAFVAIEHGKVSPYSRAVFEAYWGEDRDISRDEVLRDIVRAVGLDQEEFFEKIATPEYKDKLRGNTEELIARGGFGSPTMFVDGDDVLRQRPPGAGRASALALERVAGGSGRRGDPF